MASPAEYELAKAATNIIHSSTPTGTSVGATSTTVIEANADRCYACFINASDEDIFLALGLTATLNTGIYLKASGGSYEIKTGNLYKGKVTAICTSGSKLLCVVEGV